MYPVLEHPDITRALRTGYPSRIQESVPEEDYDEDALYEERMEAEYGWE